MCLKDVEHDVSECIRYRIKGYGGNSAFIPRVCPPGRAGRHWVFSTIPDVAVSLVVPGWEVEKNGWNVAEIKAGNPNVPREMEAKFSPKFHQSRVTGFCSKISCWLAKLRTQKTQKLRTLALWVGTSPQPTLRLSNFVWTIPANLPWLAADGNYRSEHR